MDLTQLLQLLMMGIIIGSIYSLIAAGFIIVYNVTGIINFAQGEFVMLGAMLGVWLHDIGIPLPAALLGSMALVTIAGMAMERLTIQPARNASLVTFIIITLGVSVAIRGTALLVWGTDPYSLPAFTSGGMRQFMEIRIPEQGLWILFATALCFLLLHVFFERTYTGKAVKACEVNKNAARLMGINPRRMSLLAFALSAAIAALAGGTIAPITLAGYDMGLMLGLKGFVAAVLGGLTSIPGALIGGLILGISESLGAGYISSGYNDAIAFLILVVILIFRPTGLLNNMGGKRV
ncbi:MAG: branched-chain amino acid ABC transporter permease [Chitinophagales bacterium]